VACGGFNGVSFIASVILATLLTLLNFSTLDSHHSWKPSPFDVSPASRYHSQTYSPLIKASE
jgi:hypothetical protein